MSDNNACSTENVEEESKEFEHSDDVLERSCLSAEILDGSFLDVSMEELVSTTPEQEVECVKYECTICSKKYKFRPDFRRHFKIYSSEYHCASCHAFFNSNGKLQEHMKKNHEHLCFSCGKKFRSKASLQEHASKHLENDQINVFKCKECPMAFKRKCRLEGHMNTHFNNKPFKCEFFVKEFCHQSSLTSHMDSCSGKTVFSCEKCGECFKRKDYLSQHENAKHALVKHACLCGKLYAHASSLYKHKKTCKAFK